MNPFCENNHDHTLILRRLGIDTSREAVIFMRKDCHVCRSEGFEALTRLKVCNGEKSILATLLVIHSDLLKPDEASLSESAWITLGVKEGERVQISHAEPLESFGLVRSKIYGNKLSEEAFRTILKDVVQRKYSDVHISSFLTACSDDRLDQDEMIGLTKAMVSVGERLIWEKDLIVDKHCVGGLPGNRTTMLVVPIIAAFGLTIPKTSSRAITSPAGTADTMETVAPVDLELKAMRKVVEQEGGCIVWGGAMRLSPADDMLIRVERALNVDSEGQLLASILSKKASAGSTHVVIDIPLGPTAKLRTSEAARVLGQHLETVGAAIGLKVKVVITDGKEPIGRGIGPSLEARDVLSVLQNEADAPSDLRERGLVLAGEVLELAEAVAKGQGKHTAEAILVDGRAWKKFQAICQSQGGMREPKKARFMHPVESPRTGKVVAMDNRRIARVAKLAGAPKAQAAGMDLHIHLNQAIEKGEALFTLHAETQGELQYALSYLRSLPEIISIEGGA